MSQSSPSSRPISVPARASATASSAPPCLPPRYPRPAAFQGRRLRQLAQHLAIPVPALAQQARHVPVPVERVGELRALAHPLAVLVIERVRQGGPEVALLAAQPAEPPKVIGVAQGVGAGH